MPSVMSEFKDTDFSVVLFRTDFVLVSKKNRMKILNINRFGPCHIFSNALLEPQAEDKP
jgi:hypothetical protein